jgi:hypothetical protein
VQHLLAAFRTTKIKHLELEIVDNDVVSIQLDSETGKPTSQYPALGAAAAVRA